MLPNLPTDKQQRKLLSVFLQLDDARKQGLIDYAEFLLSRQPPDAQKANRLSAKPEIIPRPAQESVIAAIKRLSKSYPMLDKQDLLHETSDLMSGHIIKGRPADEVIDELEVLFVAHYEKRLNNSADG